MKKKTVALLMAGVLAVGCVVGGSLAWLVSTPGAVTNTFTVGDINATLDEAPVDANGKEITGAERVTENNYTVIPGDSIDKDPTVHILNGSEKCYVFVCIDDQINAALDDCAGYSVPASWTKVKTEGSKTVYKYNAVVDASGGQQDLLVFDGVTIDGEKVTKDTIGTLTGKQIIVNAYAYQAENVTEVDAQAAALEHFFPTTQQG